MKVQCHSSLSVKLRGNISLFTVNSKNILCTEIPRASWAPTHTWAFIDTHNLKNKKTYKLKQRLMVIITRKTMCYITTDYSSVIDAPTPEMTDQRPIYYGGFGLISLQIFVTTSKFCLKTLPLFSFRVWWRFKETFSRLFENSGFCNTPVGREHFLPARAKASSTPTLSDAYVHKHSQGISDTFQTPEREYENISVRSLGLIHEWNKQNWFLCIIRKSILT